MLLFTTLNLLNILTFLLLSLAIVISPWLLSAWEMWYFWPVAIVLFAAAFCGGARMLLIALHDQETVADIPRHTPPPDHSRRFLWLLGAWTPFLAYAILRYLQTPVVMDAERIWLLIITFALIVVTLWLNFSPRQRTLLFAVLCVSMALQSLYGFVAFYIFDDQYVLWVPNFFEYAGRAQGSFFCPNHFSGFLEIGFGMGLALRLDRRLRPALRRSGTALALLCLAGIGISQSRGGWMSVCFVLFVAGLWAMRGWPRRTVWTLRLAALTFLILVTATVTLTDNPVKRRLHQWHPFNPDRRNPEKTLLVDTLHRFQFTSRGSQIGGALRAWRSAPIWGIGPGMHQNLWFRFAATHDGDRETMTWPTLTNHTFHSYEVHSDWVQLLEELGLVGLGLFLIGFAFILYFLNRNLVDSLRHGQPVYPVLSAGLAIAALTFHSLGDFNLQIPSVTWTLAAVVALGLIPSTRRSRTNDHPAPDES